MYQSKNYLQKKSLQKSLPNFLIGQAFLNIYLI